MIFLLAIENDEQRSIVRDIYKKYYDRMYVVSYRILRNKTDAEDAVAETFRRMMENTDKLRVLSGDAMTGMVITCTKNAAINIYNSRKAKASEPIFRENDEIEFCDETQDVPEAVINGETVEKVKKAIGKLEPVQRDAVIMRYYYNYSDKEIAEMLGIKENAVTARIFRARRKLKKMLEGENL